MSRFSSMIIALLFAVLLASAGTTYAQMALPSGPAGVPSMDDLLQDDELEMFHEPEEEAAEEEEELIELPPIKMIYVKGGCFKMGDWTGNGDDDERPTHEVCVGDYYIQEAEVTQELWYAVTGRKPRGMEYEPNKPITRVSWYWANRFIKRLNERTDGFYRLPTEAEWEYAARERGKEILWSGTNDETDLQDYAWFEDNTEEAAHEVRQRRPNALGLYDMSGNVWEWVEDNFDFDYYKESPVKDPFGPDYSFWRTIRGGSFVESPYKLRTTYRHAYTPSLDSMNLGFRLAE